LEFHKEITNSNIYILSSIYITKLKRLKKNLALPHQKRGDRPWLEMMETFFGDDFYFVHFNKQPGVADAILEELTHNFLKNLFRKIYRTYHQSWVCI